MLSAMSPNESVHGSDLLNGVLGLPTCNAFGV